MVANYKRVMNMRREVLERSVKRCNKELLRIRVNRIVVANWNYAPRLIKH